MPVTSVSLPSAFAAGVFQPAFNPAKTVTANVITGEVQQITANYGTDPLFLTFAYAPAFYNTLSVQFTDAATQVTRALVFNVDYHVAFLFLSATRALQQTVIAGIQFVNNQLTGNVTLSYTTIGGLWSRTVAENLAVAEDTTIDPLVTAWEQVASYPTLFPIQSTPYDKTDPTSMRDVIVAMKALQVQIQTSVGAETTALQAAIAHIFDTNNPHNDSATTLGLGNVANYAGATDAQVAALSNSAYLSPVQLPVVVAAALPHATDTVSGIVQTNDGTVTNAGTDNTRGLTVPGFLLLAASKTNAVGALLNKAPTEASFNVWPVTYPINYHGVSYPSTAALVAAVQTAVGVSPLEFNSATGRFWFPNNVTPPDLTLG